MILNGVRGDAQTKRLSSQFIARFFTKFPNLANSSLDALLDLCEDDDVNIRKQAIKVILYLMRRNMQGCADLRYAASRFHPFLLIFSTGFTHALP